MNRFGNVQPLINRAHALNAEGQDLPIDLALALMDEGIAPDQLDDL